jgi:hypothetical protein
MARITYRRKFNKINVVPGGPDGPDTLEGYEKEGGTPEPNGLDLEIQMFAAANPKCSTERIAKKFGQPREVVARLLGRDK